VVAGVVHEVAYVLRHVEEYVVRRILSGDCWLAGRAGCQIEFIELRQLRIGRCR
jgi:hypothetical protein